MKKKRMIALDADYIAFQVTEGKDVKASFFGAEEGKVNGKGKGKKKYKESLKPYKKRYKTIVQDVLDEIAANLPGQVEGIKVILSDSRSNFRYEIYPEYKGERPKRSELFYRLRKWSEKKYGYVPNVEADDVCAYYGREEDWIVASMDKDVRKNTPCDWYNPHYMHKCLGQTTPVEAKIFTYVQTVMGDSTDNIKGIPRVGEKTALKLLDEFGYSWEGVVKAYQSKGLTIDDAILNRRLIGMDQWSPKKGIKLFKGKKK